jgi:nicotinamidase-related amidase
MDETNWIERSRPFLEAVEAWYRALPSISLRDLCLSPARVAVFCVDLVVGFCYEGPLSSPRVAAIVPPIVDLFQRAYDLGVRYFLLPQDQHPRQAVEFEAFGPHCLVGTREAETVPELRALPFSHLFQIIPKNSLNAALETGLNDWVDVHPGVHIYIVVGDCTDLCVYQLAMHLRLRANAKGLKRRVIVPANCVDTYDLPVERARELGLLPHDGDLLHRLFLYHMALNGVEVVRELT